jgi:hypothetical protein
MAPEMARGLALGRAAGARQKGFATRIHGSWLGWTGCVVRHMSVCGMPRYERRLRRLRRHSTVRGTARGTTDEPSMAEPASNQASNRRALITMHLLGDEELTDGSERHEYALDAIKKQMEMLQGESSNDLVADSSEESRLSNHVVPTFENMPHLMKAMLSTSE